MPLPECSVTRNEFNIRREASKKTPLGFVQELLALCAKGVRYRPESFAILANEVEKADKRTHVLELRATHGRLTDSEYNDAGRPGGWRWLHGVRMWARIPDTGPIELGDHRQAPERVVSAIIADLNDRGGLGIDGLDRETQDEIRATWAKIVEEQFGG